MLIDSIKMGFSDLKKRKFRTILTAFSIAIGTMLLIVMFGLGEGVQKIYEDNIEKSEHFKIITVVNREPGKEAKDSDGNLNFEDGKDKKINKDTLESINKIDGVKGIVAETSSQITEAKIGDKVGTKATIIGRDVNYTIFNEALINKVKNNNKKNNKDNNEPIIAGKNLEKGDINSVLVGEKYLEKMGIKDYDSLIGKEIELVVDLPKVEGSINKEPFIIKAKIAGIINGDYEESYKIIGSVELVSKFQEYYTGEKDYFNKNGYSSLSVECNTLEDVKKVNDEINTKLVYGTFASTDRSEDMNKIFSVVKGIFVAAGIIVLLVSAIGVVNTMTMTVYEKTKSIGIMKAQGASRGHINVMFLAQSGVLGFLGGILGSILAVVAAKGLDKFVIEQLAKKGAADSIEKLFYTPIWAILASIGFSILVCLIAGIVPAKRAGKLNPVDSLRYE